MQLRHLTRKALTLCLALGLTPVLASPAQSLFDQATFFIGFYYNGYSKVPGYRDLRKIYQPQLDQACAGKGEQCSYAEARKVIEAIVGNLSDPFTKLIPGSERSDSERYASGLGPAAPRIGVWARPSGGGLVVVESFPGEAAYQAGIRRGDRIVSINNEAASPEKLQAAEASKTPFTLSYSRKGTTQEARVMPQEADASMQPRLEVNGGVAYLRIYHFYGSRQFDLSQRINDLVRKAEADGAKSMVIDLRDSLTGFDSEALLAAGVFVSRLGFTYDRRFQGQDETQTAENGQLILKEEDGRTALAKRISNPVSSKLPLVVLVNRNTLNSAEMMAYFLQSSGRAKVVGEATAGALGVSGNEEGPLINGEYLAVSSLLMRDLEGKPFPARVTPDVVVPEDLEALAAGRDVALEKALELLK